MGKRGIPLRLLLVVVVLAITLWTAYWAVSARQTRTGIESWLAARQADGWVAGAESVAVRGIPNRLDATVTGVSLAPPGVAFEWRAPFVQLLRLLYRPRHTVVIFPERQNIALAEGGGVTLEADRLRASVVEGPGKARPLERATLVGEELRLASTAGWSATMDIARLASRGTDPEGRTHQLGLELIGLAPRGPGLAAQELPPALSALRLDATLTFDRSIDWGALAGAAPRPTRIALTSAEARWGPLALKASGDLEVGADGIFRGRLKLAARDWRGLLALATGSGLLAGDAGRRLGSALAAAAGPTGDPAALDVSLTLRDGGVFLGPLRIAEAPRLKLR